MLARKFGKQIQKRQLEVPEYAASFVNYKALKKVTPPLVFTLPCASLPRHHGGVCDTMTTVSMGATPYCLGLVFYHVSLLFSLLFLRALPAHQLNHAPLPGEATYD